MKIDSLPKGKLAFGCMRLPMVDSIVDIEEFKEMVDAFINAGFNYFDTAHLYLNGLSELALKEALTKRYPRESYFLVDKLTGNSFKNNEELRKVFNDMLEACGVTYFDLVLIHSITRGNLPHHIECGSFEFAREMKEKGLIRHIGMSFHDTPDILEPILASHPEIEAVQLQFNYLDYENPNVCSKANYDLCVKYGKEVLVMEPVRGGMLANLPEEALKEFSKYGDASAASYAIRFAASHPQVGMVLSGMTHLPQVLDNVGYMKDFKPLSDEEFESCMKVRDILTSSPTIPCTACNYCKEVCPEGIRISDIFSILNNYKKYKNWASQWDYRDLTKDSPKASECEKCGLCEGSCPQHIEIRKHLEEAVKEFEKN